MNAKILSSEVCHELYKFISSNLFIANHWWTETLLTDTFNLIS